MKMHIFHTNDIHSEFNNLAKIASIIKKMRSVNDLVFDCGDLCDMKSTTVLGTEGRIGSELLKKIGYDAMVVGNNEIDCGNGSLISMGKDIPLISCNLTQLNGQLIENVIPSSIFEKEGIRFLVLGVSPFFGDNFEDMYNVFLEMSDMKVTNPVDAINSTLSVNKKLYDICILLSHSGFYVDEKILSKIEGIDLILGGHTHDEIQNPVKINNIFVCQAGSFGKHLGVLELEIENKIIVSIKGKLIDNDDQPDEEICKLISTFDDIAQKRLSETIATIKPLAFNAFEECDLINFICDALYKEYPCDFAIMHHGIANYGLDKNISKYGLIECLPSKLNPTLVNIEGYKIREALVQSFDNKYIHVQERWAGFRGTVLGTLGVSFNVAITDNVIKIDGDDLVDNKIYSVVMDDFLQRGSGYPTLEVSNDKAKFYNGFIRDLVERQLSNKELFESCRIKRIHI